MGQEVVVRSSKLLAEVIATMTAAGQPCQVVMVDANLVMPSAPPPAAWNEVRLKTSAGMVTLHRRGDAIALVVFGNATPELLALRDRIAAALAG